MTICSNCGAPLKEEQLFCGACGAKNDQYGINWNTQGFQGERQYDSGMYNPQPMKTSGMAIASLVLGVTTWILGWFTLGIPGILGIIFGLLAMSQCKRGERTGHGLAMAGFILSVVMVAVLIGVIVFFISLIGDLMEVLYEMPAMQWDIFIDI